LLQGLFDRVFRQAVKSCPCYKASSIEFFTKL
jgi:hypothetical protein